jgi:hypothetical protein
MYSHHITSRHASSSAFVDIRPSAQRGAAVVDFEPLALAIENG